MSCMLRVAGKTFDVENFVAKTKFEVTRFYVKGQPRYPKSKPNGPKNLTSGFNITTSEASFDDLEKQIDETISFLKKNESELRKIVRLPGVETAAIDFGINYRNVYVECNYFPPELLSLLAKLGLGLELSSYHIDGKMRKKVGDIAALKKQIQMSI